ncbi:extracellular solute-binding protein [Microbulbifer hydrolyticus]|uniref:Arabinogalactan oligomer/maltooligosaccharide transport system permease protein n=1 Tax=Microbulbifer hydrolyticus TaxID=48074 RepID=A0A6P1TEK2_9GAMM|nr:extracellular solute-binding protein [Microbulbifer hydrolyticus]MBB5212674.1 arabinogalactan oligomer/maltooligosaccharide transport system permease protein [Microbulbifer hydrolyticus]QHQ40271.1 extracellular solute-binding protein [Microbulbifer hydrolyticus]
MLTRWLRLAACFLLLVAGQAGAAETLQLWHGYRGAERAAFEKLIEEYNRSQDQVQVKALAVPFGGYADKLSAALPRGQGPDLFVFAHDRLGGWASAGHTVAPIDPYVSERLRKRFPANLIDAMTYGGDLYGLPFNFKSPALILNTDLVQAAPETTDAMVAEAMRHTDRNAGRFGLAYSYTEPFFHGALMNSFGNGPFDRGGNLDLDSPANVRSLEMLARWVREDRILPEEPSSTLVTSLFNQGRAAMVISGPWMLGEISPQVNYRVVPLPVNSESGQPLSPWVAVEGLFLSPWSRNPAAAVAIMDYLTSRSSAETMAIDGGQLPANISAFEHPSVATDDTAMAFRRQLEAARPIPNLPAMTLVWVPLENALKKVVKGAAQPEAELHQLQRRLSGDLARLERSRARSESPATMPAWLWLLPILLVLAAVWLWQRYRTQLAAGWHANRTAYLYILPAILGMTLLVFFPLLYGLLLSFTDTTVFNEHTPLWSRLIGIDNYLSILGDFDLWQGEGVERNLDFDNFYWTLLITVLWTVSNVVLAVGLALVLALALDRPIFGRGLFRLVLILPWAIPNYITALVWKGMFHPQFGVINQGLQVLGLAPVAWFDSIGASFFTGLVTNVWLSIPFMMVVILGGLQSIPRELYEAARVEGAGRWLQFRTITLPLLKPVLIPAVILSVVWTFNMFNVIYLVSDGAPAGANDILITKAFRIGFEKYQYAYAAAYSMVILALLFCYALWQTQVSRSMETVR